MKKISLLITNLFYKEETSLENIIEYIELIKCDRKNFRAGSKQFLFTFKFKEKDYTLAHDFTYLGNGVDHSFKFKKKNIFEASPFKLSFDDSLKLSEILIKRSSEVENNEHALKLHA